MKRRPAKMRRASVSIIISSSGSTHSPMRPSHIKPPEERWVVRPQLESLNDDDEVATATAMAKSAATSQSLGAIDNINAILWTKDPDREREREKRGRGVERG
ncbi:hypothetical protein Ancab_004297 [Ancistrocladus abbreviatus]